MNYCKDCKQYTRNISDPIIGQCAVVSHEEPEKNCWRFQLESCRNFEYCGELQPVYQARFHSYLLELKKEMTFPVMAEFLDMRYDVLTKMYYNDKRMMQHETE